MPNHLPQQNTCADRPSPGRHQGVRLRAWHPRPVRLSWVLQTTGWSLLLCLGLGLLIRHVLVVSQGPTDFCQDYTAAQRLMHGAPVYQPLHCWAGIVQIPTPVEYDSHPPTSVLFFSPLGWLPLVPASLLWGFLCLAAYLASGLLLLRELGWRSLQGITLFVVGSLLWEPYTVAEFVENLWQLLTLLLVLGWVLERRGHFGWAGGLVGLAGLLKIWPVALLAGGIIQRRWRFVQACGVIAALGTALTTILLGAGAFVAYWGPVQTNEELWVPNLINISLVGAIVRLFVGSPGFPGTVSVPAPRLDLAEALLLGEVIAGVLLCGSLVLIGRWHRRTTLEPGMLLSQSMLLTVLLLVFPISWRWGMITLLLPCTMLLLAERQLSRRSWWQRGWLWIGVAPLLLRQSWMAAVAEWLAPQAPGLVSVWFSLPTLGLLLFAGMQASLLWRTPCGSVSSPNQETRPGRWNIGQLFSRGCLHFWQKREMGDSM